jgi:23S rRNA pseudouridine2605 synthase
MRLAKFLAHAGVASRRASEQLVFAGRVRVAGQVVRDPATDVDGSEGIDVDGEPVRVHDGRRAVYAVNKPLGVVSTASDPQGRPTVVGLVRSGRRLYPVGRLDAETTGLILLTDDGDLAHRLMHPSYHVPKTYLAEVEGTVPRGLNRQLRAGVDLDDGPVKVDAFRVKDVHAGQTLVEVVLHEGRKHVVRRLLAEVGFPVRKLVRTAIGDVQLGNPKPGTLRRLTRPEVGGLYRAAGL